jgi:hypothetical protein
MNEKTNTSGSTRKRRNAFLKNYQKIAKEKRIRLNYKRVKKIDLLSKENKTSFKKTFDKIIIDKEKRVVRSLAKRFTLGKTEAREVYILSLQKEINYQDSFEILKYNFVSPGLPFPIIQQSFLDLIDFTNANNVLPNATINIKVNDYSFSGSVKVFNETERFNMRNNLRDNFIEENGQENSDKGYSVLDVFLEVETKRDNKGNIENFNVTKA